jgi:hypothetical protein
MVGPDSGSAVAAAPVAAAPVAADAVSHKPTV